MICAFGFHGGDVSELHNLLRWIYKLGGCHGHDAALVADAGCPWNESHYAQQLAAQSFRSAILITNEAPTNGWIAGSNSLWLTVAKHCKSPWLWMETDAVPIRPAWLDTIADEYAVCDKPFMGHLYDCDIYGLPKRMLSGISVYPGNAFDLLSNLVTQNTAFDVCIADKIVPISASTNLIQNFWGQPDLPPVFYHEKKEGSPINAFTLKNLNPAAVVFHRNKDRSLQRLLDLKMFPKDSKRIVVVYPFCDKDAEMAIKNMEWIVELNTYDFDILLSYEIKTLPKYVKRMRTLAGRAFKSVFETRYNPPGPGQWGPNVAFRHAAFYVDQQIKRPFLWCEYDVVPLKPEWLDVLQLEYTRVGMPFAGPIVQGPFHCNGTAIYPANTPDYIPETLATIEGAWDTTMKPEMINFCHDINHLLFHVWGCYQGKLHPYLGDSPDFTNGQFTDQIPASAVALHRCKNNSLRDWLRKNRK